MASSGSGYAPAMLRKLARSVAKVSPIERFNVVSDAFALSQAGVVSAVEYLELTGRFREETGPQCLDGRSTGSSRVSSIG